MNTRDGKHLKVFNNVVLSYVSPLLLILIALSFDRIAYNHYTTDEIQAEGYFKHPLMRNLRRFRIEE